MNIPAPLVFRGDFIAMPYPAAKTLSGRTETEEIVALVRLNLYNRGRPCGPKAILQAMESLEVRPLPSQGTIARILDRLDLTHRRTGYYPE